MPDRLGDKVRLQHISDAIAEIENYIENADFDIFINNSMMFNATVRQLEIIGEAANRLTEERQVLNPSIPWRQIIGLRNMVIHEYFGIDKTLVWNVVKQSLSDLKIKITFMIDSIE
jgi:uncharacterized protein with HEPN domain